VPNDSTTFEVDGQQVNMSVPSLFLEEEVWVPIEFFGLAFGVPAYAEAGNTVRLNTDSLSMAA
jgi:hypothetical protein